MTIGEKIIARALLPASEAQQVCEDLHNLDKKGVWGIPDWARELGQLVVQLAGWRAVAEAYKCEYEQELRFHYG